MDVERLEARRLLTENVPFLGADAYLNPPTYVEVAPMPNNMVPPANDYVNIVPMPAVNTGTGMIFISITPELKPVIIVPTSVPLNLPGPTP